MDIEKSGIIEMKTRQYERTFNIMKGLAIISVVIGHCSVPMVEGFVNQYHLAVFYFIAGYFFNPSYMDKPLEFIKKRFNRLYLPFVYYGLAFLLLHNIFCHIGLYSHDAIYSCHDCVIESLRLVIRMTSYEPFMGAMWFASSLFMVSVVYILVVQLRRYGKHWLLGGVILCFLVSFVAIQAKIKNPYCIFDTMMVMVIYQMGSLSHEYNIFHRYIGLKTSIISTFIMIIIYLLGGTIRLQSSGMASNNLLLFILVPLMGVIMIFGISKWISELKWAKYISICGEYSFEIMALHFISFKIVAVVHSYFTDGSFTHLAEFPVYKANLEWWTPVYTLAGCVIPILITSICRTIKLKLIRR